MKRERLIPALPVKRHNYLLIICAAAILCFSQAAPAQSGRRQNKSAAPAQTPVAAEPAINPPVSSQTIQPQAVPHPGQISSLIVAGHLLHDSNYFRTSGFGASLKICMDRLKNHPRPAMLEVTKGGWMNFNEAKERAKKETNTYVLWIEFVTKDDSYGDVLLEYIEYALLAPESVKMLTSGRIYPGRNSRVISGGLPPIRSTSSHLPVEYLMKEGAKEVAERLIRAGWLD